MTQEEFEYWWNVIFQPTYTLTKISGGTSPSKLAKITINFPKIPKEVLDYINDNYDGWITINPCYHGNNGTRHKHRDYECIRKIIDNDTFHNAKLMFKNKKNVPISHPNYFRWSILGKTNPIGEKQGTSIYLEDYVSDSFSFDIDYGYSLRHLLNRWLYKKSRWINHIIEADEKPTSYHTSEFKYYYTLMLHLGNNVELGKGIVFPKILNPNYISETINN